MRAESKPRETTSPKRSATRRAAELGLLSGAALGMSAGEVMATIIDFGPVPTLLSWGTSGSASTNLNLEGLGPDDLALRGTADPGMMRGRVDVVSPGMMITLNVLTNGSSFVRALAYGALIGTQPSSSFAQPGMIPFLRVMYNMMLSTYTTQGSFNFSSPQYFGFQFYNGTTLVNAWGLLNITGGPLATQVELLAGSFEDSGGAIAAGAGAPMPEPGTGVLAALGLGALGVRSMRLRKKERAARAARESSPA